MSLNREQTTANSGKDSSKVPLLNNPEATTTPVTTIAPIVIHPPTDMKHSDSQPGLSGTESTQNLLTSQQDSAADTLPSPSQTAHDSESEVSPGYDQLGEDNVTTALKQPNRNLLSVPGSIRPESKTGPSAQPPRMQGSYTPLTSLNVVTNDNNLKIAEKLLQDIENRTRPIHDWEYLIVIFAACFAAAASSAAHDFSRKFLQEVAHVHNEKAEWAATIAAGLPQFCLSLKTNIDRWSILLRSLRTTASFADIRTHLSEIAITLFSAIPTCKVGRDTADFKDNPTLAYSVGVLRSASAIGTNGYFLLDHRHKKKQRAQEEKMPIIRMLVTVKKGINDCNNTTLMNLLNNSRLLKRLREPYPDPVKKINDIMRSFIKIFGDGHFEYSKEVNYIVGQMFAGGASTMNWKAGFKSPELFKLETAKDIIDFCNNVATHPYLLISFSLGALLIGLPAAYVNYLINYAACKSFIEKMLQIKKKGVMNYFKEFTFTDWLQTLSVAPLSLAFGAANGGMAAKYPFINSDYVAIPNAIFTGSVFAALGSMSINNLIQYIHERQHQELLLNAIHAPNLSDYFNSLTPEHQKICASLMKKYLTMVVDAQIGFFVDLEPDHQADLLAPPVAAEIEDKFGDKLKSVKTEDPSCFPSICVEKPQFVEAKAEPAGSGCCPRLFSGWAQKPRAYNDIPKEDLEDPQYDSFNRTV